MEAVRVTVVLPAANTGTPVVVRLVDGPKNGVCGAIKIVSPSGNSFLTSTPTNTIEVAPAVQVNVLDWFPARL